MTSPYNNQQLFSDHYLEETLPRREDWQALIGAAEAIMPRIAEIFTRYQRGGKKEAQTEYRLVRPILELLGHTFEVQPSLKTSEGPKTLDYIFYRDHDALNENAQEKVLTDAQLRNRAFAVGDAKYWNCPLDHALKSSKEERQLLSNKNPTYQIAFYMLHSELEWGILTNGRLWRLYHKATAHKLDHYYEVDLPALLETGDAAQFLYFYAFFRRAAFDVQRGQGQATAPTVAAILQESLDYARGISEALEQQVYDALRLVAQGFLDFAPNQLSTEDSALFAEKLKDIYDNALILLYRLLFIFYAEARNLLPLQNSALYAKNYSLQAIARSVAASLDESLVMLPKTTLLTYCLQPLFQFINEGSAELGIGIFNGGLFDPERYPFLERYRVGDAQMQQAIDKLARVDGKFIDYRDLSVRGLGTIYEGLLEYHLQTIGKYDERKGWKIDLLNENGARKATGSYYTPDYIVKYIVDEALGPLLQQAMAGAESNETKAEAVLAVKALDPSVGSGHFLVEATEYIARFLVEQNIQPEGVAREAELAYWKRRVVQSCIYGVDLNPLAVELAKLSLWLSTVARDRPLSFLDHHLRVGNSLFGARFTDLAVARGGTNGKRKSRKAEPPEEQMALFDDDVFRRSVTTAVDLMWLVKDNPAQTVQQVKEQESLYASMRQGLTGKYEKLANLIAAQYFGLEIDPDLWLPLADFAAGRTLIVPAQFEHWIKQAARMARERRFFHWELEFPEVFFDRTGQPRHENGGFDAVIGNPPWIRQESFSADKPALERLYQVYHDMADLSTYFVELGNSFLRQGGRFGFIIPNKFMRANYGEPLRRFLTRQTKLERLVNFRDLPIFHDAVTYPLILLTSNQSRDDADAPVYYTLLRELHPDMLAEDIAARQTALPASAFDDERWPIEGVDTRELIAKLHSVSIPLGEHIANNIFRGILTGFNRAFVIDEETCHRLILEDRKSVDIIKPFVVGKDIKRYKVNYQKRYIILTKIGTDMAKYPAIMKHLEQYEEQLKVRSDKGNEWWELRSCDYYDAFAQPKIIFPDIASSCQFAYDADGLYSANTTYIMPIEADQKYLLSLLNSRLLNFFFRAISARIRGDYLRFFTQYVAQVPIRRVAFTTPLEERAALLQQALVLALDEREYLPEQIVPVEACLAHEPEQADVVYDLPGTLAESLSDLYKQREAALSTFMHDLAVPLTRDQLAKLRKLWTPLPPPQGSRAARKKADEVRKALGYWASQPLTLEDAPGKLDSDQWRWLLWQRLPDLSYDRRKSAIKALNDQHPLLASLEWRIRAIEELIDKIVYRLYGLTENEIAIVEGKATDASPR
ncbi:MAG: TaqI-like C-terminal specificity domain-containing protein [Ktedonobacteraceae bacterium]